MFTAGSFFQEMLILYGIAGIGFVARRYKIFNKHANEVLTGLTLYITLPALILVSLDIPFSMTLVKEFLWLATMSIYFLSSAVLLGAWLRKRTPLTPIQQPVFEGLVIFGNQGFIGFAVVYALLGELGIVYLTMFNLCYFFLIWTYGIYLFSGPGERRNWRRVYLNPGIMATLAGTLLFLLPIQLPNSISKGLEMVGMMTIPLSMLLIGSLISTIKGFSFPVLLKNTSLWKIASFKLIILPLLLLPFALLSVPNSILLVAVIVAGMPSAPTIALYAQKYGGDAHYASIGVMFTTMLCLVTIPFLYWVVNLFFV